MAGRDLVDEETTERSTLLGHHGAEARPPRRRRASSSATSLAGRGFHLPKTTRPDTVVLMLCAIIFVSSSSGGLYTIPITRIFEDRLCHQYYDGIGARIDQPIDEELCKVDAVQSRLSFLFATCFAIEAALGCLVAMPWGLVADRIGRRPVFALVLVGMTIGQLWAMAVGWFYDTLPIQLFWLGPLGLLVGGGNAVATAIISSMLADVLPEKDRAIGLMRIHVSSMVGNLFSPALSSVLMPRLGPWPLLCASEALLFLPVFAVLFLPETLHHKEVDLEPDQVGGGDLRARLSRSYAALSESLSALKGKSVVLLLACCLAQMPAIICTLQFLDQFASKRYHIPIAYTGYIQGAYGAAHALVVLVIIPIFSSFIMRPACPRAIRMPDERQRDLTFARWSFIALAAGALVMGLSPVLPGFVCGLFIMALGSGAGSYIGSTLTFYVDQEHRTRMFSVLGMVNIAGNVYAMPALAGLFTLGMRLGGEWISLPYLGVSTLCMTALIMLLFVRLPRAEVEDDSQLSACDGSDTAVED